MTTDTKSSTQTKQIRVYTSASFKDSLEKVCVREKVTMSDLFTSALRAFFSAFEQAQAEGTQNSMLYAQIDPNSKFKEELRPRMSPALRARLDELSGELGITAAALSHSALRYFAGANGIEVLNEWDTLLLLRVYLDKEQTSLIALAIALPAFKDKNDFFRRAVQHFLEVRQGYTAQEPYRYHPGPKTSDPDTKCHTVTVPRTMAAELVKYSTLDMVDAKAMYFHIVKIYTDHIGLKLPTYDI